MDFLKKFFFLSFKFNNDVKNFIIGIVIYFGIGLVWPVMFLIPIVGLIAVPLSPIVGLYNMAGIVISILVFTKVIKTDSFNLVDVIKEKAAEKVAEKAAEAEEAPVAETTDAE